MLPATADLVDRLAPRFTTIYDAVRHMARQGYVFDRARRTFTRPGVTWRLGPAISTGRGGGRAYRLLLQRT